MSRYLSHHSIDRAACKCLAWAALACCIFATSTARSSQLAADSASNSVYAAELEGAWKGLDPTSGENPPGADNGGFGFLPWDFSGGYHQPQFSPYGPLNHFIDGVDFLASSYNDLGSPAFGLSGANVPFGGDTARATRILNWPLLSGQTISVDFDNPAPKPIDQFASAGFLFRLNTGQGPVTASASGIVERFGLFVAVAPESSRNWIVTDAAGFTDTNVLATATTGGAQFRFTLTGQTTYEFKLVRRSDPAVLFSRSGTLANTGAGPIDSIEIALFDNGSGNGLNGPAGAATGEREFFFTNTLVTTTNLIGDYNVNGIVDAADYTLWRNNLGDVTEADIHLNGDGLNGVDRADFLIWKEHYGETLALGTHTAAAAANVAPELSSIYGVFSCSVLFCFSRQRNGVHLK